MLLNLTDLIRMLSKFTINYVSKLYGSPFPRFIKLTDKFLSQFIYFCRGFGDLLDIS
jgi:hypothetical protein